MTCKNCNLLLAKNTKFCTNCGAKVIQNRLTLKNLCIQFSEQFFNYDNKLLKTFVHLFTKPEAVICSYIDGTRKRYINIIQYFALSLTLVGIQVFLMNTFFKEALESSLAMFEALRKLPNGERNPFATNEYYAALNKYQSLMYIISVPIAAISSWIAYKFVGDKRYNFTEHVVINLFYSSQVIIINSLLNILLLCLGINIYAIASIIFILTLVYLFYVLKRVFTTSFIETFARYLLIYLVYLLFFLGIFILAILSVFLYKLI